MLLVAYGKEAATRGYDFIANEYKNIAQNIKSKRSAGKELSADDLKAEYFRELARIVDSRNVRPQITGKSGFIERFVEINDIKRSSFASYTDYYSTMPRSIINPREDTIWLHEDGNIIFEGKVAHDTDVYLIGTTVERLTQSFDGILASIQKGINSGIAHYMHDELFRLVGYWARLEEGYIEKTIDLEELNVEKVMKMYDTAIQDHEFPDEEKLQAIRTRISDYLMWMNENR